MSEQNTSTPAEIYIEADNADIIIDGRIVPVPVAFAADDDTLRAALAPHCAWIANARLDRKQEVKAGVRRLTITAVKQGGPKGQGGVKNGERALALPHVIVALRALPCRLNAAVALSNVLEAYERSGQLPVEAVVLLAPRLTRAAARGKEDAEATGIFRAGLRALPAVAARHVPMGF